MRLRITGVTALALCLAVNAFAPRAGAQTWPPKAYRGGAPRIAQRARFVGMHGSVRVGYGNDPKICAEYNVKVAPKACQQVFTAPWDITITPLDTCDKVSPDAYVNGRNDKYGHGRVNAGNAVARAVDMRP